MKYCHLLPPCMFICLYYFITKANTFYFLQLFKRINLYFLFLKQDFKLVNILFLSRQSHKFRSGRRIHSLTKCLAGPGTAADEMIFWRDNLLMRRLRLDKLVKILILSCQEILIPSWILFKKVLQNVYFFLNLTKTLISSCPFWRL